MQCPSCGSERTRRGGPAIWIVYVVLIVLGLGAVLVFKLNAAIVAGIMIAAVVVAHLVIGQHVCLDCGNAWRAG